MRIGIDFDNTIVCYDALFHRVCRERELIPASVPINKSEVRNYLRRTGREDNWTEIQGYVYGLRMAEAQPYPGVREFFRRSRQADWLIYIISHKTKLPFRGEPHDLHQAAINWLCQQGFFDDGQIGLSRDRVFFELTKQAKLDRIVQTGCTHFIDDLPEFLAEPAFPAGVQRILFDPNDLYSQARDFPRVQTWAEIGALFAR
jgi:FMN phosphatase YigB (HAD superfamily)